MFVLFLFFFFKQKTAYEMRISDWSPDVCSSDLSNLHNRQSGTQSQNTWRQQASPAAATGATAGAVDAVPAPPVDEKWFIPGDFDTSTFLATAKTQFREIQAVWDSGDLDKLRDYMTDDLIAEAKPEIVAREAQNTTDVVPLNRSEERPDGKECVRTCRFR